MAWVFESGDVVSASNNAVMDFPDAPWFLCGWVKIPDNAGSNSHRMFDFQGGTGYASFAIAKHSHASMPDEIWGSINDGADSLYYESNNTNPFLNNAAWTWVAMERNTSDAAHCTCAMYVNNTYQNVNFGTGGYTNDLLDAITGGTLRFGNNPSGTSPLIGHLAEWGFWDRIPTSAEKSLLNSGYVPSWFRQNLRWYVSMRDDFTVDIGGFSLSNSGAAISSHPTMILPQDYLPDAILASTNLTGSITDISENPDA